MTCWSVLGLNRGLSEFLNFLGAPMLLYRKSVFLMVNVSLCWLINFSGMYLVRVFMLLIDQCGLGHFFRYPPLIPRRIMQIYANA
jgi:hypothetical protein